MSVHLDIGRPGRVAVIEASGACDDIAAELTAAVGVIYAQFCQTGTSAGAEFREAVTAMLNDDAPIWGAATTKIKGGYGRCVVYEPQEETEG